jgi:hypothetical protein
MRKTRSTLLSVFLLVTSAACLTGAPVVPTAYSLINGEVGTWIYRDTTYLPCPGNNCNTNLAFLSGGTGMLTDGVLPATSWNGTGNPGGTPVPYVGWANQNPLITFSFAGSPTISQVGLYVDNTPGTGDVRLPDSVNIGGTSYDIAADPTFGPRWLFFDIPTASYNTLTVTLNNDAGRWMMLGEVSFDDGLESGVPEPASIGLFACGAGALAVLRFRKSVVS